MLQNEISSNKYATANSTVCVFWGKLIVYNTLCVFCRDLFVNNNVCVFWGDSVVIICLISILTLNSRCRCLCRINIHVSLTSLTVHLSFPDEHRSVHFAKKTSMVIKEHTSYLTLKYDMQNRTAISLFKPLFIIFLCLILILTFFYFKSDLSLNQ